MGADDKAISKAKRKRRLAIQHGDGPKPTEDHHQGGMVWDAWKAGRISEADYLLRVMVSDMDGNLRINCDSDGVVFYKWRFNRGRWANHYVLFVASLGAGHEACMRGLLNKVMDVRRGERVPTLDRYD